LTKPGDSAALRRLRSTLLRGGVKPGNICHRGSTAWIDDRAAARIGLALLDQADRVRLDALT
jgi:hypothetical protein